MDEFIVALDRLVSLTSSPQAVMNAALPAVREEIQDLQALQMLDGLTVNQTPIVPPYSLPYAQFKGFNTPNLYLEGDFQRGITVDVEGDYLIWDSTDEKTPWLAAKYEGIFGIGGPYLEQGQEYIQEEFLRIIDSIVRN